MCVRHILYVMVRPELSEETTARLASKLIDRGQAKKVVHGIDVQINALLNEVEELEEIEEREMEAR